ncbi:MAG: AAA family ATPase [Planctomycetes bacterium]|nr:AAA family ATPase [Planctomycetota bacterium]
MAPFAFTQRKNHPYAAQNPDLYGHFRETSYTTQPYSAACVPFRWMLSENVAQFADELQLDFQAEREPALDFNSAWIQERKNQLVVLDTFFGAVEPKQSLCFFYAKDTPLSSSGRRVILGVGRVLSVGDPVEYEYDRPEHQGLRCVLWERNIAHSIRPGFSDGFLFPYTELLDYAVEKGEDPERFVAFAPDEAFGSYSYATEHVSHDHAIASILSCVRALEEVAAVHDGPWQRVRNWLDEELNRLWRLRGPFPGFGSALTAFLGPGGNLVAYEIAAKAAKEQTDGNVDPWPEFEAVLRAPDLAGSAISEVVGEGFQRAWVGMSAERKALLKLLSRFSLSADQAKRFFDPDHRPGGLDDAALLANPYLLYELDRASEDPIAVEAIDRGLLPSTVVLEAHPLPEVSSLQDRVDPRRVRALVVAALEAASGEGHTLLPRGWLTDRVAAMPLDTPCPVGVDVLAGMRELFAPVVIEESMADGSPAYQLDRYQKTGDLIRETVQKRVGPRSRRHELSVDWRAQVDEVLGGLPADPLDREAEEAARTEKAAALEELAISRLSVLIGAAGTGKTTLLKMLFQLEPIVAGGILLLAPTGKARVQLERKTGQAGKGQTIAQFLMPLGGRYDPRTGAYCVTGSASRCGDYKTVIIDECSMLTEEQLAALLDAMTGVERFVFVGDHRQLPPIGSGRSFVDIVRKLAPEDSEVCFPRVAPGFAELTIPRRQQGAARADLVLAGSFAGGKAPGADEIWDRVATENLAEIEFIQWTDPDELHEQLLDLVVAELGLSGRDDEAGFECKLSGGEAYANGKVYFRASEDPQADCWQIISPVRPGGHGVEALNALMQRTFRRGWMAEAQKQGWSRKINPPQGRDRIIYGDKVINLQNSARRKVWPKRDSYVANGDVGLVVGSYKSAKMKKLFKQLEVEFTSQPSHKYTYLLSEFGDEGSSPLELAYALTVHKTQGSEFGTSFVVLPDPCWLLSRELLYTALTRQQDRVIVLHQGDLHSLRKYSREEYSDLARRMTNLFQPPAPVEFAVEGMQRFLEEGLIHRTKRGDLVRSKSEVIIANELFSQGIDRYAYEQPLKLSSGAIRYPDFTIIDHDTGETFYWEHLGMLHNPEYAARWERKLAAYRESGIALYEDGGGNVGTLVVTRDDAAGGIDARAIAQLIQDVMK